MRGGRCNEAKMDIQQIVDDIYALNCHLQVFEKKYALSSDGFYEMYVQGELDNGEFEQIRDFVEWAGFYKVKLELEDGFRRINRQRMQAVRASRAPLVPTTV